MELKPYCIHPVEGNRDTYKNHPSLDPSRIPWDYHVVADTPVMAINHGIIKDIVKIGENWREWDGLTIRDKNKKGESFKYSPYGYHVIIDHYGKGTSAYCHLMSGQSKFYQNFKDGIFVKVGDKVEQGQVIGVSGCNNITRAKEWAIRCDKNGTLLRDPKTHKFLWSDFTRYNENIVSPGPDGTGWSGQNYDFSKGEIIEINGVLWFWPELIKGMKHGDHLHFEIDKKLTIR